MSTNSPASEAARVTTPAVDTPVAPSNAWRRVDAWLDGASEWLNPILVKETRQALKSQQFVMWFLLLLAACWVVTIGGIAWIGPSVHYAASGGVMFLAYYYILALALVVVVPFAAYRSLAAEQEDNTRDVLMVSALTPRQVIDGKIGSAVLQMMVYLSALAPCIAFTYLLRGIDLLTIFLLPTLAVLASLGLSLMGLVLASATRQRYSQVLTSVGLVATLLGAYYWCVVAAHSAVEEGYLVYDEEGFWLAVAASLTFYACAALLAYFSAAALNAFASSNRSTALRRVLLLTQACFVGWIIVPWLLSGYDGEAFEFAAAIAWVFWAGAGALLTSEHPVLSERVRRTLPVSTVGRWFTTWLNPGPGTGYLFVVSNVVTLALLFSVGVSVSDPAPLGLLGGSQAIGLGVGWSSMNSGVTVIALGAAYTIGLLGIGRLAILGLRKVATLSLFGGFLVHFLILLASVGLPELLRASVSRFARPNFTWYDLSNPFRVVMVVWDEGLSTIETQITLIIVLGIAGCVFLLNLTLAAREIQLTRAPLPQRVIEDDLEQKTESQQPVNPWGDVASPG